MTQKLIKALSKFTMLMTLKFHRKFLKGYHGWDETSYKEVLLEKLNKNLKDEDYVDVANFAMSLWYLKEKEGKNKK